MHFSVCSFGYTLFYFRKEIRYEKLLALILTISLTLCTVGCSNTPTKEEITNNSNEEDSNKEADKKSYEYEQAQKAYAELNKAAALCEGAMNVIYAAWYFAIYEGDKGDEFDLSEATGLTYGEISDVLKSWGYSTADPIDYGSFNNTVMIAKYALIKRGVYSDAQACIDNAKTYLKEVTNEYADYTSYPTLKLYYSEVSSYLEFAQSPSGSFSQLKTTIDNYETKIRTYKNDLSFTLE